MTELTQIERDLYDRLAAFEGALEGQRKPTLDDMIDTLDRHSWRTECSQRALVSCRMRSDFDARESRDALNMRRAAELLGLIAQNEGEVRAVLRRAQNRGRQ